MRKLTQGFIGWCADTSAAARFERTVVQGVVAVAAAGLTTGQWDAAALVGVAMAVLTPVQAALGRAGTGGGSDDDDDDADAGIPVVGTD